MNSDNDGPLYDWMHARSAGVLLHISSLPSDTGIGNLGKSAYRYIDFLGAAGFTVWQLCPLGPTGYGDSPYQCFSAFAGNPYFIDLDPLTTEGLIVSHELEVLHDLPTDHVDYGSLYKKFWPILNSAFMRFQQSGADHVSHYGCIREFRKAQSEWLEDYALFLALKDHFAGKCWLEWPANFRDINKARKQTLPASVAQSVEAHVFFQYIFYGQLAQLRAYASKHSVEIMGDVPIFVALDSSDVWSHPELFQLKKNGAPSAVAGVPPDYFSDDGQLWGNPLYQWEVHTETNYAWWVQRIQSNLDFYDIVRLDHFRGFESYWSVPAAATTARGGRWIQCPGLDLFTKIRQACPDAKLIAEDLGVITDDVNALRHATGLPGMVVLQFAFGGESDNVYLPHNYELNTVVYSGTHDNDTTCGWYKSLAPNAKDHVRRYLNVSGDDISWDLTRAAIRSSAKMAIAPLQDLMSLGNEARLNMPGSTMGNWQWRYSPEALDKLQRESASYLADELELYGRR